MDSEIEDVNIIVDLEFSGGLDSLVIDQEKELTLKIFSKNINLGQLICYIRNFIIGSKKDFFSYITTNTLTTNSTTNSTTTNINTTTSTTTVVPNTVTEEKNSNTFAAVTDFGESGTNTKEEDIKDTKVGVGVTVDTTEDSIEDKDIKEDEIIRIECNLKKFNGILNINEECKIRPGVLVLVNNTDWELLNKENTILKNHDLISFISTLHGG